jgi:predicted acylesterase/phospholipase RssA
VTGPPDAPGPGTDRPVDRETAARTLATLVADPGGMLIDAVVKRLEWIDLGSGDTLFEIGDESDAAYLVIRGRLRVTVPGPDGTDVVVRDLGRGEVVGELGLINKAPRSATIRSTRDTSLARLAGRDFLDLTAAFPDLAIGVANTLLERSAHPAQPTTDVGSVALVSGMGGDFTGRLLAEMQSHGPIDHLWRDRVESLLEAPGITEQTDDAASRSRLASLLANAESATGRLLLETDPDATGWTRSALRSADLALFVTSPAPGPEEEGALLRVRDTLEGMQHVDSWLVVVHPEGVERAAGTRALRERFAADAVVHVRLDTPADMARLGRLASGRGIGLVLGGGGARGFAHLGVYRALQELGVPVDHIGGSSMGAVMGAAMAKGLGRDELLEVGQRQFRKVVDYTVPVVSLAKGRRAARQLSVTFGGMDFEDLWTPFFCMSTNLTRTLAEVHDSGDLIRALRAGFSIPGVYPPTPIGDDLHVDAGVLDNLPVAVMRSRPGVGTVVAVDVAPPVGPRARADYGLSVSGWKALRSRMGRRRSVYPGITTVLMRSMILGSMRQRDRLVADGAADLYLDLDLRGISLLDFTKVRPVADAGYEASLPRIEEWLATTG